jgi:LPXTG-motif cell wall-anchored protein
LPATGGNSGMLATWAVLLVIGGAGVAMLARIRRRPAR